MSTYVLVHGAWHTAAAWDRVAPLLTTAGHRVLAPTLTGYGEVGAEVGLDTHVDDIVGLLGDEDAVVLVGHSYAGMVITGAANRMPEKISHLVFLDAMVPRQGESALDVMPVTQHLIDQASRSDDPRRIPPMSRSFGVTDPADLAWLDTILRDHPVRCLQQPVAFDDPVARAIPRTHIHCTVGAPPRRPVPPSEPVWELPTGHDCMITMPVELSELLLKVP
ncbi:alpha/beta hydrolase [Actinoplanes solisilvae]|uniref:alpha/beta hydrolase n=1 Tax=Actinoplanes solisilvae TaxID=2486853 RepID=UPI000FDA0C3D|nr:alpha/beta hydrolase [Actinoplanes solisilvae]